MIPNQSALGTVRQIVGKRAPGGNALARARQVREGRRLSSKQHKLGDEARGRLWSEIVDFAPNWIVAATATNPSVSPIARFSAQLTVPSAPQTTNAQTVFIFIGLQDGPASMILQPVLQWNLDGGFASRWSISSWFVQRGTDPAYTAPIAVNPGDVLRPKMTLTKQQSDKFTYECGFDGYPRTFREAAGLPELKQAACVLEAYGIQACSDYPSSSPITITNIALATTTEVEPPAWQEDDWVIDCGQRCSAAGDRVELYCR